MKKSDTLKIFVVGTRGIPHIPGGVEKHCEELYPRIAAQGHEVILCTRDFYVANRAREWRGVKLFHSYAPHKKSLEAIVHTFLALLKARSFRPDIVHIHTIGPALLTPFARLLGYKVVVTTHGPDYDRQKWGKVAKTMLLLGEKLGGVFAHEVIAISSVIAGIIRERCHREAIVIYNGVPLPSMNPAHDFLDTIGVAEKKYILAVARFVPEKGLHDLMEAFISSDAPHKLVIAGDADHETDYSRRLRRMASADPRIILTGYITGAPLHQVYRHARMFVLPSYHEGLPIALLEAMSYGLSVLVSDIPANREVGLQDDRYFKCGDVADLREKMSLLLEKEISVEERNRVRTQIGKKYDWDDIARRTIAVYQRALRTTEADRDMSPGTLAGGGKKRAREQ
jgi:glycosyltransferase involved in cell wall biosynthesis